jgi:hypothetical protein
MNDTVTTDDAQDVIGESTTTVHHMGEKTTVLHCQLPNGYELVVSSQCVDPADFTPRAGLTACFDKLETRIIDLLAREQHGPLR